MRRIVNYFIALLKVWWALMSCAIFTIISFWSALSSNGSRVVLWGTAIAAALLFFAAAFSAWAKENERRLAIEEKYSDETPVIGLEILSAQGPSAWRAARGRDACWFWLQHLGGRIPRSIRFDPIESLNRRFTLEFDAVPFLDPPRRTALAYRIQQQGFKPLSAHDMEKIGDVEGQMLACFLDDSPIELIELRYILRARFKDKGDEERTRDFNVVFDKGRAAFLPNTD
jgi:hypothetical protein